ncbi:MAG: EamA family transporter [Ardenticatenaceae bacterium]|nr:EamA family transporter [Ardenticatenaceae bacterium]
MHKRISPHAQAVWQALLVTFLWSTSWVLIKLGLQDIPPVTFAGLRYFLAFLALIPFYRRRQNATPLRALSRRDWLNLIGLGLLYYTITQGSQFMGLAYLPAITFSLLLNSTAVVVTILGIPLLREIPTWLQWGGMLVFVAGALVFFYPLVIPAGQGIGYVIAAVHILATSLSSIAGRGVNRGQRIHPLTVTMVSMGVGSVVMLAAGLLLEPWPQLTLTSWAIVVWLAVVNTAVAFTIWNHTLRTLSAMESSIINNTMLIQITVLAWLFLGETLTGVKIIGLVLAALGALLVQVRFGKGRQPLDS